MQGHPNPHVLPYVDVATGSLGQGLPIGVGMALNGKYLDKLPYRVWVLLGDSEMAEGSNWEAFDKASYYKLDNLIGILDMNRLGQRGATDLGWDSADYAARARAFGWHAIELDGHDLGGHRPRLRRSAGGRRTGRPSWSPRRRRGTGSPSWTTRSAGTARSSVPSRRRAAIAELGGERSLTIPTAKPEALEPAAPAAAKPLKLPTYEVGGKEATRKAYGDALVAVGANRPDLVALDSEVSNSTFTEEFKNAYPDRFFEMFIAEQQLVSAAVGLAVLGKRVVASTFAAFFTRAFDQIRMAAVSNATLHLVGSHCRGQHRPGRPVADGPRRHRDDADRPREHDPVSLRPESDGRPGRRDGGPARHLLPAHDPGKDPGDLSARASRSRWAAARLVRHSDRDQVAVIAAGITRA